MKPLKRFLYLVVVGGRSPKANIELHDVRWVIGSNIQDTFDQLRNNWFGYLRIDKTNFKYSKNHTLKKIISLINHCIIINY